MKTVAGQQLLKDKIAVTLPIKMTPDEVKLVRNYNRKLSVESMKKRVIGSAVTLGIYMRGINEDSPLQDCFEALLRMNDNDIMEAQRYTEKTSAV